MRCWARADAALLDGEGDPRPVDLDRSCDVAEVALADVPVLVDELAERHRLELVGQRGELGSRLGAVVVGQTGGAGVSSADDDIDHRRHDALLAAGVLALLGRRQGVGTGGGREAREHEDDDADGLDGGERHSDSPANWLSLALQATRLAKGRKTMRFTVFFPWQSLVCYLKEQQTIIHQNKNFVNPPTRVIIYFG